MLVGLFLVWLTGWTWLDPVVGLGVAVNILWTGFSLLRRSFDGLMDHALPEPEQQALRGAIQALLGPEMAFHALRTRQAGSRRVRRLSPARAGPFHGPPRPCPGQPGRGRRTGHSAQRRGDRAHRTHRRASRLERQRAVAIGTIACVRTLGLVRDINRCVRAAGHAFRTGLSDRRNVDRSGSVVRRGGKVVSSTEWPIHPSARRPMRRAIWRFAVCSPSRRHGVWPRPARRTIRRRSILFAVSAAPARSTCACQTGR